MVVANPKGCEGIEMGDVVHRVCQAIDEANVGTLDRILTDVEERNRTPRVKYACRTEPMRDEDGENHPGMPLILVLIGWHTTSGS
jgi:hypothetical protein